MSLKNRASKHVPGRTELEPAFPWDRGTDSPGSRGSFLHFSWVDYSMASSCPHSPALWLTALDLATEHLSPLLCSLRPKCNCSPFPTRLCNCQEYFFPLISLKPQTYFSLASSRVPSAFWIFLRFLSSLLLSLALLTSHHHQPPKANFH